MNLVPQKKESGKTFRLPFQLTAAQQHIHDNSKRFTLIRAGRKFGKTKYMLRKILDWMGPPNSCVWYICPTYRQGKLISWSEIKRLIPPEILHKKPNDADLTITLKNGSELYYMGSDEPNSLRGPAPTGVLFDEAAYHRADVWEPVVRPNLAVHEAPALFVSSPCGFNWFKDLEDAAEGDPEWATFKYTIYDNPHISREEIEKIKAKADPRVWSQEYMAEYESSVGRVFHEFQDTPRHTYSFPMPTKNEDCYRAIDWGLRDDCGQLWAVTRGGKVMVYRENADHDLPPAAQARILMNRTPATETVVQSIIGHDAARTDVAMQGLTVQWHFSNVGVRPLRISSRKKDQSRAMLQQLISEDRLVIHPECRKLRKQLLAYSWKDTAMEKTDDGGDDLVDALHYMVEMLQYKMFLTPRKDEEKTLEQMYAEIREEKKAQQVRRYPLVQESNAPSYFDSGSPAGYF